MNALHRFIWTQKHHLSSINEPERMGPYFLVLPHILKLLNKTSEEYTRRGWRRRMNDHPVLVNSLWGRWLRGGVNRLVYFSYRRRFYRLIFPIILPVSVSPDLYEGQGWLRNPQSQPSFYGPKSYFEFAICSTPRSITRKVRDDFGILRELFNLQFQGDIELYYVHITQFNRFRFSTQTGYLYRSQFHSGKSEISDNIFWNQKFFWEDRLSEPIVKPKYRQLLKICRKSHRGLCFTHNKDLFEQIHEIILHCLLVFRNI